MQNFMEIGSLVFAGEYLGIKIGCSSYNTSNPVLYLSNSLLHSACFGRHASSADRAPLVQCRRRLEDALLRDGIDRGHQRRPKKVPPPHVRRRLQEIVQKGKEVISESE